MLFRSQVCSEFWSERLQSLRKSSQLKLTTLGAGVAEWRGQQAFQELQLPWLLSTRSLDTESWPRRGSGPEGMEMLLPGVQ